MLIADKIKEVVRNTPEGVILTIADFGIDPEYQQALVMSLSRMVRNGELEKVSKGKYYKPRNSIFGTLGPSQNEIAKDFLVKGGKTIGYITGTSAFSVMGLTTQITSSLLIGTSKYRRPVKRGRTVISFLVQSNPVTEENIPLLMQSSLYERYLRLLLMRPFLRSEESLEVSLLLNRRISYRFPSGIHRMYVRYLELSLNTTRQMQISCHR